MNNTFYKISVFIITATIIPGCAEKQEVDYVSTYTADDAREILGYDYKDAPDIELYSQYMIERKALEEKYMLDNFNQDALRSEYEKIKDNYQSSSKGPIEFARNSVPELNQTIEAVEEQIDLYNLRIRQLTQELIDLNYIANDDETIIQWNAEKKELEATAVDLLKKREDLYLTFRKFELNPQNDKAEAEYQTMILEAQISIERIQQSFKD